MTTELKSWVPSQEPQLELGPARWNGTTVVSDVSVEGAQRLIGIGLVERLVLEQVDGKQSVADIQQSLQEDGVALPESKIVTVLNKFAFFGIIQRPFAVAHGTRQVDAASLHGPTAREDQVTASKQQGGFLSLWKQMPRLGTKPVFTILAILAVVGVGALVVTVPYAFAVLKNAELPYIAIGVVSAILWSTIVTITHENAHAAVFNAYSNREPYLALTRFGIILMPNTHMPGISLMQSKRKIAVIAAGPLTSLMLAIVPVAFFWASETQNVQTIIATCVLLDAIIIGLGISFFPNTDATRILETASGVDQIQAVATRTLTRKYRLPSSLPKKTRVAVRAYPVLLLATIGIWLAVIGWAIRLILS
ncbi:MAG: hypothetical protein Q4D87_08450 [Actinomycetaceae bacterium]|nr:hypothetical protein [Actinomycetaceae bacterium]